MSLENKSEQQPLVKKEVTKDSAQVPKWIALLETS